MSRTNWTKELDVKLVDAVDQALAAGLHKTKGPSRTDGLYVGFWTAVAVIMADSPKSPTSAACAKRHPVAIGATLPHDDFDLVKFGDLYEAYDVEPYQFLAQTLKEMQDRIERLCREWGV